MKFRTLAAAIAAILVLSLGVYASPVAQDVIVGGLIRITGPTTARTFTFPDANAYILSGTAAAKKVTGGQLTTASATDTVVTGLSTVTSCTASFETDPADANVLVSCFIGDQAGTPAAGSIIIKTWKTDGSDPTPAAATAFSKKVNWIAYGS